MHGKRGGKGTEEEVSLFLHLVQVLSTHLRIQIPSQERKVLAKIVYLRHLVFQGANQNEISPI